MSRGLGRIQLQCLKVIEAYGAAGKLPTTFNIAAEVYRIKSDSRGNRIVSHAQHVATKRALASLRERGLVSGDQQIIILSDGTKILSLARSDGRAERCCFWTIKSPQVSFRTKAKGK